MKPVLDAIMTKFSGSTFSTNIGGRLYYGKAPADTARPYATFTVVSDFPEYTFTEEIPRLRIQFSIFDDGDTDATALETAFLNCKALFDWCTLSISGFTHLSMVRDLSVGPLIVDEGWWMKTVDYIVTAQKTL